MNVPAIAKKSYDEHRHEAAHQEILSLVSEGFKKLTDPIHRAKFLHKVVDSLNEEIFSHPLVQQYSPCKMGCTACCHTQVSVTEEEAKLLVLKINEGVSINENMLKLQMQAKNDSGAFYHIRYDQRRCIFLDEEGSCKVYDDRPSVCRTNAVLGSASQCDTSVSLKETRLVKTTKADVAIYSAFKESKSSGTLPYMIGKLLGF